MNYSRPWMFCGLALMAAGAVMLWRQGDRSDCRLSAEQVTAGKEGTQRPKADDPRPIGGKKNSAAENKKGPPPVERGKSAVEKPTVQTEPPAIAWKKLFDGKTLKGWKSTQFGGEGKVYVRDGAIVMEMGSMMTGVTWTGKPPRNNYELTLEGMRLDGSDFFCTTTFPVGKDCCSLVVGGWGGLLVGLSSVDRLDASENQTTTTQDFKDNKWYRVRIRVSDAAVEAWIDDNQVVNQPRKGHEFGIRDEVDLSRPLGICTWATKGAVRNVRLRELKAEERK